jgi:hypothetical protein
MWLIKSVLLLALSTPLLPLAARAQEQATAPSESNYEFFSGTVLHMAEGSITVSRAVLGKPPENRNFLITNATVIEGKLKAKARVTVGYKPTSDGDLAVRIIVRPQQTQQKKP